MTKELSQASSFSIEMDLQGHGVHMKVDQCTVQSKSYPLYCSTSPLQNALEHLAGLKLAILSQELSSLTTELLYDNTNTIHVLHILFVL